MVRPYRALRGWCAGNLGRWPRLVGGAPLALAGPGGPVRRGLAFCHIPSPPTIHESHEFHECSDPPVPEPFVLIRAIRGSTFRHHRIRPLPHHSGKARERSVLLSLTGWRAPTGLRDSVCRQPGPLAQAGMGRAVGAESQGLTGARKGLSFYENPSFSSRVGGRAQKVWPFARDRRPRRKSAYTFPRIPVVAAVAA